MRTLLARFLAVLALASLTAAPVGAAADRPLVIISGQTQRLPTTDTLQVNASSTTAASINLPHGAAPASPTNGDCWTTTGGLYCRINGATVGPYGAGGVTSVDVSGGTTGLTTSGGPITSSGTITLGGTLAVANGGTGSTTASAARSALGLAIGSNVQAWDADLDALAALTGTNTLYYRSAANTWSAVTIGSNLTFSGGTLAASTSSGVTTTGTPASGNLATFSGASTITNGDLSGDVTTSGTLVTTLASSGATAGTYGDATHVSRVTVDAKGRVTSASSVAATGVSGSYGAGWSGSSDAPTKNDIYAKIQTISPGGTGSGLFAGAIGATPTIAGTGLSTVVGTSAASADSSVGIFVSNSTTNGAYIKKAAPGTPYTITVLLAAAGAQNGALGWTDGTKYQVIYINKTNGNLIVQSNSAIGTFAATNASLANALINQLAWLRIRDDGTNVTFSWSADGVNFVAAYTVAKASGYLGSSGYSSVVVGGAGGAAAYTTVMSYSETS